MKIRKPPLVVIVSVVALSLAGTYFHPSCVCVLVKGDISFRSARSLIYSRANLFFFPGVVLQNNVLSKKRSEKWGEFPTLLRTAGGKKGSLFLGQISFPWWCSFSLTRSISLTFCVIVVVYLCTTLDLVVVVESWRNFGVEPGNSGGNFSTQHNLLHI